MLKIWDTIAGRLYTSSVLQSFLLSLSWSTRCTCIYMPPYMTSRLLNARQLREDFKVQGHCSCRCTLRSVVAGTADHRPYSLPVQWLPFSMVLARNNSTLLLSGLLFAALLCLKHIYLYLAPAYFVYLLRAYCLGQRSAFPYFTIRFFNCVKLGVGILAVFGAAFGPFAMWGQTGQVLSRLFPFSRGLCHAYWAPNVWAMYSFSDRVLIYSMQLLTVILHQANTASGPAPRATR
jgi:hypothetical protein